MSNSNRLTMKSIPVADRPTEKLSRIGGSALSDAELLAIIIRSGMLRFCLRVMGFPSARDS